MVNIGSLVRANVACLKPHMLWRQSGDWYVKNVGPDTLALVLEAPIDDVILDSGEVLERALLVKMNGQIFWDLRKHWKKVS